MNENPLVSVIVPVYNTENYLEKCIQSCVDQAYENIEIIVINDGSTDNSPKICKRFQEADARIKYIAKDNSGVSDTRNVGIDSATGEYLMFVDSDDILDSQMIGFLVGAAEKDNSDLVICGNYNLSTLKTTERNLFSRDFVFEDNNLFTEILQPTLGPTPEKFNPAKLDKFVPIWARLYKTSILKENNIRFIDLKRLPSECLQFNFEFCLHIDRASYVNKPLYYYRRNTVQSVTKPFRPGLIDKWMWWVGYIEPFIESTDRKSELKDALNGRIVCSLIPLGGNALKILDKKERRKEFSRVLNMNQIQNALSEFNTNNTPFYWQLFFNSARKKNVTMFMFLTWAMRKILKLRKA